MGQMGLGIKDILCFSNTLLEKWKWRLGREEKGLFPKLLSLSTSLGEVLIKIIQITESLNGAGILDMSVGNAMKENGLTTI